ncbi:type VI secretion system tip protein VgrG [Roseateles chitosanitabidus]|uniref:type VI secretion system tip protein VgrG n=1 Tax=Roseateles chitosanitabidus TaxID=65048 RepID=UPI00082C5CAC|nr:type VI secretion system tip protein VgrG [Roseateles chitosanitabidus]
MPAAAPSPALTDAGALRVVVSSAGEDQAELPLISVSVRHALNTISWARLVIADGDMTTGKLEIADGALFRPGTAIVVKAGYGDDDLVAIFRGVVVRTGFKVGGNNYARLEIDCRHTAFRATLGRRSAHYVDQKDSAILETLLSRHGVSAKVTATTVQHPELAQHHCCDWDFIVARADATGMVLHMAGEDLVVEPPAFDQAPVLGVTWGRDLIDFQADIDARTQWTSVQASSWDPSQQDVLTGESKPPSDPPDGGDLSGSDLAAIVGLDPLPLQSCAPLGKDALDVWASAAQTRATLARRQGRIGFQGHAAAVPGAVMALNGLGARFGGHVYLTAVQHELTDGEWTTHAEFGRHADWHVERADVAAPANGGLVPGVSGLQVGVVMKLDEDPLGEFRIQLRLPALQAEAPGIWARLAQAHASSGFGHFFVPEIGDEVLVGFLNDDPSFPVVLGALYSSQHQMPYAPEAKNNTKAIVTRCLHRLEFNEEDKIITLVTPGKNTVVLDDKNKRIRLEDENGNSVELAPGGITLDSPKAISITAGTTMSLKAATGMTLNCDADISASGANITAEAKMTFTGKGSAAAELSAAGQTIVKGAMVMIN